MKPSEPRKVWLSEDAPVETSSIVETGVHALVLQELGECLLLR